jgi:hypothetical protein
MVALFFGGGGRGINRKQRKKKEKKKRKVEGKLALTQHGQPESMLIEIMAEKTKPEIQWCDFTPNYQNELNALALMLADKLVYKCPSMQCQDINCYVLSMLRSNVASIHL